MKAASSNRQNKKPSRVALADWGSLLSHIANELDGCISALRKRRRGILEVREEYFPFDGFGQTSTTKGLECLASELGGLDHGMGCVVRRLKQFDAKLFWGLAIEEKRQQGEFPESDLDEV
jgi:hypothetical protein